MFWVWRIIVWEFDIARLRYNIFQYTTCSMHLFPFFFTSVQLKHQKKTFPTQKKDMSSVLPSLFPSGSQSNGFATGPVEWLRWKWCCHSSCGAWRVLPLLVDHERSVERCGVSLVASVKVGKQSPKVWRLQNILGKNTCNTLCIDMYSLYTYIYIHQKPCTGLLHIFVGKRQKQSCRVFVDLSWLFWFFVLSHGWWVSIGDPVWLVFFGSIQLGKLLESLK